VRDTLAGWSLQRRLITGMLIVLALPLAGIAAISTVAFQQNLTNQLDNSLDAAANRSDVHLHPDPATGNTAVSFSLQSVGTVNGIVTNTHAAVAQVLTENGPLALTDAQVATVIAVPADGRYHSVTVPGLGNYRLTARPAHQLSGFTIVTGLPLSPVNDAVRNLLIIELAAGGAALVLAGSAGTLIVGGALSPLRRVAATARQVAELPLARGDVDLSVRVPAQDTDPRTEVGQVGAALNRMLGHVGKALAVRHASETRVRQFVADASHELRTPLAAIRGYAELTRRGRETVPDDVAHALTRIEAESRRMTGLVDDLLLLARLDSGRPLEREPVQLSRLIVDAVGDAHAAGPDHTWRLTLPEEPVTVTGDRARLQQVLGNLLTNARVHTPAGTTVTTSLSVSDGWATLAVADNGPGIAEELRGEIFERFVRGDSSRSRAAGSTGLGLAIVAAVVEAHAGHVQVDSHRPGGTVFRVYLPEADLGH
jgi:two-component system OmpR family sensor kinase